MKISLAAEYALRAIVCLADHSGEVRTTAQLANEIDAPPSYLAKVVMDGLRHAGIVDSCAGSCGGFVLTRDLGDVTILDVVNSIGAFHPVNDCPLGPPAQASGLCPLHRRMDNVMAAAENAAAHTTIKKLIEEPDLVCNSPCIVEPVSLKHDEES